VFSLGSRNSLNKDKNDSDIGMHINDQGVAFRSPIDGSAHFFSPEGCVDIQCDLGSDIMMMLDVCSPAGADHQTYIDDMQRTHARAHRQYMHHQNRYNDVK
jgi:queuine tRNA-ribosyltransferase